MDSPLRLITTEVTPASELAKTVEALLVVASQPLPVEDLAAAAEVDVLHVAGRAWRSCSPSATPKAAAGSCSSTSPAAARSAPPPRRPRPVPRLFEKPVEKGLSQAALETLAIVAYLGPMTRPEVARIRGVNVDGVIAGLAERGLVAEGGRENEFGAIRYRTTPLFERVFGLESLAALPRVDDLGDDVAQIRERLEAVGR